MIDHHMNERYRTVARTVRHARMHTRYCMYAARRASGPAAVRSALFERSLPVRMNMNVCVFVVSWTPGADPRPLTYMVYSTVSVCGAGCSARGA